MFSAEVKQLGDATNLQVGFEYRDITGQDVHERVGSWTATDVISVTRAGAIERAVGGLAPGHTYEVRAVARHPLLNFYGGEITLKVP